MVEKSIKKDIIVFHFYSSFNEEGYIEIIGKL